MTSNLKDYRIRAYRSGDKIADLDLTDDDGSDPLGVDEFFKNKAEFFLKKRFCSIFIILHHEKIVGCFTLSMHGIQKKYVNDKESADEENIRTYPCVLLGQIGIDKSFRGKGLGRVAIQYIIGLSRVIGLKIASKYIVLQTNQDKIKLYEKLEFTKSNKSNKSRLIWMYKEIEYMVM